MDALSIALTMLLASRRVKMYRIILAAALGGVFGVIDVLFVGTRAVSVILSVVVSLMMILISCGVRAGVKFYAKYTLILWGCAALLAGGVTLVCSIGDVSSAVTSKGKSALFLVVFAFLGAAFFMRAYLSSPKCESCKVKIRMGNDEFEREALVDTGNMVRDPINALPVMFVRWDRSFPRETELLCTDAPDISKVGVDTKKLLRAVPVTRAGGTKLLWGLRCRVFCNEKCTDAICVFEKVSGYGGFAALVSPSFLS